MTRPKDLSIPQTPDHLDNSEQALGLDLGPAGANREVWRELVETDIKRHQTPGGSYAYVAERLIGDDRLRDMALTSMKEVLSRCRERDGTHRYVSTRRAELDAVAFERHVRALATGFTGRFMLATRQEILPRLPMMTDDQYDLSFYRYCEVMGATDGARPTSRVRRTPLSLLFEAVPCRSIAEFEMPARGVLTGHLVHQPLMGDLAELLAVAGGLCADRHPAAELACGIVRIASKAPPLVIHNEDGPHLVFICAD
jgi:hypothetical protein